MTAAAFASMYFNDPVCFGRLASCMRKMRETRGWLFLRVVGFDDARYFTRRGRPFSSRATYHGEARIITRGRAARLRRHELF